MLARLGPPVAGARSRPEQHSMLHRLQAPAAAVRRYRWQQHRVLTAAPDRTPVRRLCKSALTPSDQQPASLNAPVHHLPDVLDRVRSAVGVGCKIRRNNEVVMLGTGKHLGTDIVWSLRWLPNGAYQEEIKGKHMSFKWGWDGSEGSSCWEQDNTGVARYLEYDDHESMLLSSLVRTGSWLQPGISSRLAMHLELDEQQGTSVAAQAAAASSTSSEDSADEADLLASSSKNGSSAAAGSSSSGDPAAQPNFWIALRLLRGRIHAKVRVCSKTFRPIGVSYPLSGDVEVWKYKGWKLWTSELYFPEQQVHYANTGAFHRYNATTHLVQDPSAHLSYYTIPYTPLLPEDASYESEGEHQLAAWHCASGHIVVDVELAGQAAGYMLLDTGANGFVIEQETADRLALQDFGELYAFGIAGKLKTKFRKASSLRLGPLKIQEPVFMEMPMAGLIRDAPGPVVGIVGYDLFRRAIVSFPQHPNFTPAVPAATTVLPSPLTAGTALAAATAAASSASSSSNGSSSSSSGSRGGYTAAAATNSSSSSTSSSTSRTGSLMKGKTVRQSYPQQCTLALQDPTHFSAADEARYSWVPLSMIANLPHVEVTFQNADGKLHSALFMIDSGAGGADIMFHARATKELGLVPSKNSHKTRYVKGVGGEQSSSMRVEQGDVPWVEIAGNRLENVKCLFCSSHSLLDVSLYSMGIICADLLTRTATVVDYSRKRIGFPKH